MPELNISVPELKKWGDAWISDLNNETLKKKDPRLILILMEW